ncbi:hypothetical protein [Deinococcus arenicola]|uniref:MarR family transcriptional regulator n=1 Tax=Deinococcus arenicola TaxID=2994950 RepID=A0ABU4DTB7_9DEIO|nr:hypothetical protein [Deinococcus sp. ZS9-10]MDV6375684.1 hypothetical protein [Deinococcus sp. ZS9-10]
MKRSTGTSANLNIEMDKGIKASSSLEASKSLEISHQKADKYSQILLRIFNLPAIIQQLKNILGEARIRYLYIFIDDFSELPEQEMKAVVDTVIAPLNNWSNELIKFKIAAYPHRIYLGEIDRTKIDDINLDPYSLYGNSDVTTMEDKSIDFTKRIVEARLKYYIKGDIDIFFDENSEIWKYLYFSTMSNPRNLGYILFYLHEMYLLYDKKISLRAIREAAQRYYEEKIESYFRSSKFLHDSFNERSSIYSLKELLEKIVDKARELKSYSGSTVIKSIKGYPPTSHFHIPIGFDSILSTLELNFFVTKYFEMKDRDGVRVSVFALNYGLCQKYSIEFGRPKGLRIYRLYFIERIFDYTKIINDYVQSNQEIVCGECGSKFELNHLSALKMYSMKCPKCKTGYCTVTNLSKKYSEMLKSIDNELLLPSVDLGILQILHDDKDAKFAADIAEELDCSYQMVGKRSKLLDQKGFISRSDASQGRRTFEITGQARDIYFSVNDQDHLDLTSPENQ